jgi:hypothetical protein
VLKTRAALQKRKRAALKARAALQKRASENGHAHNNTLVV